MRRSLRESVDFQTKDIEEGRIDGYFGRRVGVGDGSCIVAIGAIGAPRIAKFAKNAEEGLAHH